MKTGVRSRVLEGQTVDGRTDYDFPALPGRSEVKIAVGRDPDHCTIVFADELRHHGLGNEHLTFRRSHGRYQLDLNTQNAVLVDGRKAFEEKELRGTHVIQLGNAVKLQATVVEIGPQRLETLTTSSPTRSRFGIADSSCVWPRRWEC